MKFFDKSPTTVDAGDITPENGVLREAEFYKGLPETRG